MIGRSDDLNIWPERMKPLPTPGQMKALYPANGLSDQINAHRETINAIMRGEDPRLLLIAGPCSAHNAQAMVEYCQVFKEITRPYLSRIFPVIRIHVEKPRTLADWPGIFYDPIGDRSGSIGDGIRTSRYLIWAAAEMGLPVSTEIMTQYTAAHLGDLLSFCWIGARNSATSINRWIVSGLSAPFGAKNSLSGDVDEAAEGLVTSSQPHSFIGPNDDGVDCEIPTKGNKRGIMVLRGGKLGPNYGPDGIREAKIALEKHGLAPMVLIDAGHGNLTTPDNPKKDIRRVPEVVSRVLNARQQGEAAIRGIAIESYFKGGKADRFPATLAEANPYLSLTDPCISLEDTAALINEIYVQLARR